MNIRVLMAWLLISLALPSYAARAKSQWRTYATTDGRHVTARLWGDEWQHCYVGIDGTRYELEDDRRLVPVDAFAPPAQPSSASTSRPRRISLNRRTSWDPNQTYRQLVVLVEFSDKKFDSSHSQSFYKRLFNEPGFNQGRGPGCVADYFRDQSGGLFNVFFDVVGPVTVDYSATTSSSRAASVFRSALSQVQQQVVLSNYDWGKREVEQVVFIYAGYSGNEDEAVAKGCIWPATDSFISFSLQGYPINTWSASAELWASDTSCGIGTICHEYSHCLGLPDLYPTMGSEYSVYDEWDLMDGGNFSDDGWCPCNYSIHEKMLLSWDSPLLLESPVAVADLKPLSQGGQAYIIYNDAEGLDADEFYLLENRQWTGWDACLPGHGLLISHIDYSGYHWTSNLVNVSPSHHRSDLFHADDHDYNYYEDLYGMTAPYEENHNLRLQNSAYPFEANNSLTDTSQPAAILFNANRQGSLLMGKPLTQIAETLGSVSFKFCEDDHSGVPALRVDHAKEAYSLDGRRLSPHAVHRPGLRIAVDSAGKILKLCR